ncbi:response regulator [Phenylobacterium sp.]|uniref:response regulator n=1 Tax=Phenylobacterium sp. TaxID=1871053 RepID=UPI00121BE17E|nr:response regulator [Phenylobacterium sp.]THD63871.1 MAG: response regulator [Phenylobacterium sp.]
MTNVDGPRLLYVEDEPLILELGVTAFEDAGFSIVALASGAAALAALTGGDFRALVTDIDLGGQIDGWHVAKQAREQFPEMAIIYVSGGSSNDWASKGVPGSVMIVKPYATSQLIVAVSTALLGPEPS